MAIYVGSATSAFLSHSSAEKGVGVGVGSTTTTGRDAGIGTAVGTLIYNTSTTQLEVFDGSVWIGGLTSPFVATGGTKDTTSRSGYIVHTFTGDGSFVASGGPPSGITAEYLIIGGGGSGGAGTDSGGGGGAGALRFSDSYTITPGSYSIQVGGGGAVAANPGPTAPSYGRGSNGTPSFIGPVIAPGGGAGGGGAVSGVANLSDGIPGGSGGGGGTRDVATNTSGGAATGTPGGTNGSNSPANGWGNQGGEGRHNPGVGQGGAGGGGAGGAGSNWSPPNTGGTGGNGLAYSITGTPVTRAGGGGAAGGYPGPPGPGGGGRGAGSTGTSTGPATVNTGSGGGGSIWTVSANSTGASGIVIIAYPTS